MLIIKFYDEVYLFQSISSQLSNIVDDHDLVMIYVVDSHLGWSWSIFLNHVIWTVVGMSCTYRIIHLAFWSYVVILWSDRTGTFLASYVAWGGVRCGFISLEVWRQKSSLHLQTFALMRYIWSVTLLCYYFGFYLRGVVTRSVVHCIHVAPS
jgi:hypothetical protein